MDEQNELLEAMQIIAQNEVLKKSSQIYFGLIKSYNGTNATVVINGVTYNNFNVIGSGVVVGKIYPVFIPQGNFSNGFILQTGKSSDVVVNTDKTFVFNQAVASDEWKITHNLNKFPSVSIVDSGNNQIVGNIRYIDANNCVCSFTSAFSGKAYLN